MHYDGFGEVTDPEHTPASSPRAPHGVADLSRLAESETMAALAALDEHMHDREDDERTSVMQGRNLMTRLRADLDRISAERPPVRQPRPASRDHGQDQDDAPTQQIDRRHLANAMLPKVPNLAVHHDDEPTQQYDPRAAARLRAPARARPEPTPARVPRESLPARGLIDVAPPVQPVSARPSAPELRKQLRRPAHARPRTSLPAGVMPGLSQPPSQMTQGAETRVGVPDPALPEAPSIPPLPSQLRAARARATRNTSPETRRALESLSQPTRVGVAPPPAYPIEQTRTPPTRNEEWLPAEQAWSLQTSVVSELREEFIEEGHASQHVFTSVQGMRVSAGPSLWNGSFDRVRSLLGAQTEETNDAAGVTPVRPDRRLWVIAFAIAAGLCAACTAAWVLTRTPQASAAQDAGPSDAELARIMIARTGFIVSTHPTGARIHVDGRETARFTPERVTGLTPGLHSIELKLAGYYDTNLPAVLEEGSTLVLPPVTLRPLPAAAPVAEP